MTARTLPVLLSLLRSPFILNLPCLVRGVIEQIVRPGTDPRSMRQGKKGRHQHPQLVIVFLFDALYDLTDRD